LILGDVLIFDMLFGLRCSFVILVELCGLVIDGGLFLIMLVPDSSCAYVFGGFAFLLINFFRVTI